MPALDGLRGLAVVLVFLYHAGHLRGGFLGVSTFFTLSGFLITSLLLLEHDSTDRVDMGAFWGRRARRLLPAAYAAILGICVWLGWFAGPYPFDTVTGDVGATLLYVSNWRFIFQDLDYSQTFQPSMFTHFWSLAIEEQFYLVFPLLFVALRRGAGGRRSVLGGALGVLLVGSLVLTFVLDDGRAGGMVYLNTFTRSGEILVGALLAVVALGRRPQGLTRRVIDGAGLVALAAVVVAAFHVALGDAILRHGGLLVFALVSATVVTAIAHGDGVTAKVLSVPALRWIGLISYGVYLIHYPVIRIFTPARTGIEPGWGLTFLQALVTVGIAVASYHLLEVPIRQRRAFRRPLAIGAVPALGVMLLGVGIMVTNHDGNGPTTEVAAVADPAADEPATAADGDSAAPVRTLPVPSCDLFDYGPGDPVPGHAVVADPGTDLPKVMVVGDSVACTAAQGIQRRAEADGTMTVLNQATLGCGLFRDAHVRRSGDEGPISEACDWEQRWPDQIAAFDPDLVVVLTGAWDVADRQLPGDQTWVVPGDPTYDESLAREANEAHDLLTAEGASVAWLAGPRIELGQLEGQPPQVSAPSSNPVRMVRHNEAVAAAVADTDDVTWVDLHDWLEQQPGGSTAADRRPDGVHFSAAGADELAAWLNPQLEAILAAEKANEGSASTGTGSPPSTTTISPSAPAVPADPPVVTVIGDSLGVGLHPAVRAGLGDEATVDFAGFGGFLHFDPGTAWATLPIDPAPHAFVMFFNTWENAALRSGQALDPTDPGWVDRYREEYIEPFIADARRAGTELIWVGMPIVREADIAAQQQELNAVWELVALAEPGVTWIDGPVVLGGPGDGYVEVDRTVDPPVRVLATDGLHLCPEGAERLAEAVLQVVNDVTGAEPVPGWQEGPWRLDPEAYQWGSCPVPSIDPADGEFAVRGSS